MLRSMYLLHNLLSKYLQTQTQGRRGKRRRRKGGGEGGGGERVVVQSPDYCLGITYKYICINLMYFLLTVFQTLDIQYYLFIRNQIYMVITVYQDLDDIMINFSLPETGFYTLLYEETYHPTLIRSLYLVNVTEDIVVFQRDRFYLVFSTLS